MYYSDHHLYVVARQRQQELLGLAAELRFASLYGKRSARPGRVLMYQLGAFLTGAGRNSRQE